jgi:hypothetical protein
MKCVMADRAIDLICGLTSALTSENAALAAEVRRLQALERLLLYDEARRIYVLSEKDANYYNCLPRKVQPKQFVLNDV